MQEFIIETINKIFDEMGDNSAEQKWNNYFLTNITNGLFCYRPTAKYFWLILSQLNGWLFCLEEIHMIFLDGFDSYMLYKLLADFFHTSITEIYWSVAVAELAAIIIIAIVYYLIRRSSK